MFGCVLVGCLSCKLAVYLVLHKCFYMVVLDQSFPSCVSKIQKLIKSGKSKKVWLTLLSFVSKYVLRCTFVQMVLCIYKHNLFPMHSYHCGRNFEIYVTVVNRSSTLSWMTSKWFCWSWDMHRLVLIYLPTLLFLFKKLTKCKSPNKKRYWAAKVCRTY